MTKDDAIRKLFTDAAGPRCCKCVHWDVAAGKCQDTQTDVHLVCNRGGELAGRWPQTLAGNWCGYFAQAQGKDVLQKRQDQMLEQLETLSRR